MIFFVYQSKVCIATVIFYTCFYFPFLQAKRALLGFIHCVYHFSFECPTTLSTDCLKEMTCSIDLPMGRYGDLRGGESCCRSGNSDGDDEACSVCLVEFESEDLVNQLRKCGHVFHAACVERWLDENQFSCPLCRSLFLNVADGCSHAACSFSCS
ncbi:hypothetical protein Ancab_028239 [Ancistrocladus abbreviatus]